LLVATVSFGVGAGMMLGVIRIVIGADLASFIFLGYATAYCLTVFSREEYVRVAWDSAGVTTGPVTVPFVLSLGLHFGNITNAPEGFGILTCASFAPIIAVLSMGMWVTYKEKRIHK